MKRDEGAACREKSEQSRFEWSLSSRVAGCVSDEHFIWHNPVYESLNVHAHTRMSTYVCAPSISSVRREWTGNGRD